MGTASAFVDPASIQFLRGLELLRTYQPSEGTAKTFCGACGSNVFGGGWPDSGRAGVRLSAIDSPFEGRPQGHGFTRSLAPWETLPEDGLPRTS
ncbi:MAG: GFA family protein [Actinobacteria bacterium]|nr:GFA family protein [Actinomycetota bacterium]